MPNPSFMPVIGRDFSDIAGQQQFWAQFNRGVEEGNIQRMQQTDLQRNQWLRDVALMARQDAATDASSAMQAQDVARQNAMLGQQEARRQYEWGIGRSDRARELALNAELQREKMESDLAGDQQRMSAIQAAKEMEIESDGSTLASNYLSSKTYADQTRKAYDDLLEEVEDLKAKESAETDIVKRNAIAASLKDLRRELRQRDTDKTRAETNFQNLVNRARDRDFDINEQTGQIVHRRTNKRWSFMWPTAPGIPATPTAAAPAAGSIGAFIAPSQPALNPTSPLWSGFAPTPRANNIRVVSISPK